MEQWNMSLHCKWRQSREQWYLQLGTSKTWAKPHPEKHVAQVWILSSYPRAQVLNSEPACSRICQHRFSTGSKREGKRDRAPEAGFTGPASLQWETIEAPCGSVLTAYSTSKKIWGWCLYELTLCSHLKCQTHRTQREMDTQRCWIYCKEKKGLIRPSIWDYHRHTKKVFFRAETFHTKDDK